MRLLATADLHYDFTEHRHGVEALAERICGEEADALVLAGDTFALDPGCLIRCLRLFDGFRGEKLLVAGNHDIWTAPGGDSFKLYAETIPNLAEACGFHDLDLAPTVIGDVAIVGTMGWYDYSFRDESLGIPRRFYEAKAGPGYALAAPELRHLIDPAEMLPKQAMAARSFWMDGRMVQWRIDDREMSARTVERLEAQLAAAEDDVRAIVAVTHHLPFEELLTRKSDPSWGFGNAFMGSVELGRTLLRHPKITHAICGHSHARGRQTIGHIEAINVGSTYAKKRLVTLDA